ncbi:DUF4406 domain-containing protein [bacterium]|nr:DUF4406 domain-containing protein [bacterium]MBV5348852.1 DUF4406 domain-containing protein [bacterium]
MQIFISGSFDHEDGEALFADAGELVESVGMIPIVPGKTDSLTCRLKLLLDCDGVLFLRNFQSSNDARIEKDIAEACRKLVLFEVIASDDRIQQIKDAVRVVTGLEYEEYTKKCRERNGYYARLIFANQCQKREDLDYKQISQLVHRDLASTRRYLVVFKEEIAWNKKFRDMVGRVEGFLAKCVSQ